MKASAGEISSRPATTGLPTGPTLGPGPSCRQIAGDYGRPVPMDADLLAELRETKARIDELQTQLKDIIARLQESGASPQEIAGALRG